jgi:hypothetical protein
LRDDWQIGGHFLCAEVIDGPEPSRRVEDRNPEEFEVSTMRDRDARRFQDRDLNQRTIAIYDFKIVIATGARSQSRISRS